VAVLNERLRGRSSGGFATCIALHIDANGTLRIANAGHLPPYLNGAELPVEGSLPLGLQPEIEYPSLTFEIEPGDRLTLLSDGVVEATNANREMFGFERARAISTKSAAQIAEAAGEFGQRDDITVLIVERATVAAYVG
jgi:serine phosphatase RsbU (regulator of sigma subunit)